MKQLELAIDGRVRFVGTPARAVSYREIENIRGLLGTAVNVQSMVYGNMGDDSGTGVAFTRNPNTGENKFFGEFLINAQGEDVVAGIRTPQPVAEMPKWNRAVHKELLEIKKTLEDHYKEMQDIEFTIERGTLYMLQTRTGKRTGVAAVKIACDMVKEKLIDEKEAVLRVPANDLTQLLLPSFKPTARNAADVLCRGLPASPGAAVGKLAFSARKHAKARRSRRESHFGSQGNQSRRRRRHERRRGYSDQHRRHDQPRRRRRPRLGQMLRRRCRRNRRSTRKAKKIKVDGRTFGRQGRDQPGRHHGRSDGR